MFNRDIEHYVGNNPVKYIDPDGKSSDWSDFVISFGINGRASSFGTLAVDGGIIINPDNYLQFGAGLALILFGTPLLAGAGAALIYEDAEEIQIYGSASGGFGVTLSTNRFSNLNAFDKGLGASLSASATIGIWRSMDDVQGVAFATGGSFTFGSVSIGGDLMTNLNNEVIGVVLDIGVGYGSNFESHAATAAVTLVQDLPTFDDLVNMFIPE